jgi:hypothetical protein
MYMANGRKVEHFFSRGLEVRIADIVWCADDPGESCRG